MLARYGIVPLPAFNRWLVAAAVIVGASVLLVGMAMKVKIAALSLAYKFHCQQLKAGGSGTR